MADPRAPDAVGQDGTMHDDLVRLIVHALRELDGQTATPLPPAPTTGTRLFGRDGCLDSLALVTLVVAVEQAIETTYGISVSLADDRAMSQAHSPYRTVGSLADYAGRVIGEGAGRA